MHSFRPQVCTLQPEFVVAGQTDEFAGKPHDLLLVGKSGQEQCVLVKTGNPCLRIDIRPLRHTHYLVHQVDSPLNPFEGSGHTLGEKLQCRPNPGTELLGPRDPDVNGGGRYGSRRCRSGLRRGSDRRWLGLRTGVSGRAIVGSASVAGGGDTDEDCKPDGPGQKPEVVLQASLPFRFRRVGTIQLERTVHSPQGLTSRTTLERRITEGGRVTQARRLAVAGAGA